MRIEVLRPHGFCAGVRAALTEIVRLADSGARTYCFRAPVHSAAAVAGLTAHGVVIADTLAAVPPRSHIVFPAHGVTPAVRREAAARELCVHDLTCPRVAALQAAVRAAAAQGKAVVILGERTHAEVEGLAGAVGTAIVIDPEDAIADCPTLPPAFALFAQTSLAAATVERAAAELSRRYEVENHAAPCPAAAARQAAVREFVAAHASDGAAALLVVTDPASANGNRLAAVARAAGMTAFALADAAALADIDLGGVETLGVTAAASTPESVLTAVVAQARAQHASPP